MIRRQQLPTRRLHKVADIHRQPPGLNYAAVGPAVRVQRQAATGHQRAAGVHHVGGGDAEFTQTDMRY
ncbi:hypothetical protein [Pseudomonas fluorescens]|uniref:hypothetical protein n=1 Tax=Pseudomonas fluorescens TaxID=294 RepID=UPI002017AE49|nr:hypothetical protein [Pseudomonas fluorescens]